MGKFYDHLPDNLRDWAREQKMFWVASAPLSKDGHVNLSPKVCTLITFGGWWRIIDWLSFRDLE
jgi:hypothetical protein